MHILIIDPFYDTSHKAWAEGYQKHSQHQVTILSLPPRYWKWRMYGSSIELAKRFRREDLKPDIIIATDMMDVSLFKAQLAAEISHVPIILYFHENQLTYPWSETDQDVKLKRDRHYGFMNYTSALVADYVLFNSKYHHDSFLGALPQFLGAFPDFQNQQTVNIIREKAAVLYLGLELSRFDSFQAESETETPIILWNHRWEYDKNPDLFFKTLFRLKEEKHAFKVIILGNRTKVYPPIFDEAKIILVDEIIHFGFAESFEDYASLVWKANILPVTNIQDFFGISIVEAAYCNTHLLLPNRLTYPELFPAANSYSDEEELYIALKAMINQVEGKTFHTHRSTAGQFSWEKLIVKYDKLIHSYYQEYNSTLPNSI